MRLLLLSRRSAWFWLGLVVIVFAASVQFDRSLHALMQEGFRLFPYQDDWGTPVNFLTTVADGSRSLADGLWRQHNESRKVTYKLIALLVDRWQRVDSLVGIWFSFAVRIATVIVACWPLIRLAENASRCWRWVALGGFAFGAVIYGVGPANLINGLWFVQVSFFLGLFFALLCLQAFWDAVSGCSLGMALFAAVSGSLAIFSFSGNTLLLPVCLICMLALLPRPPAVHWKAVGVVLLALSVSAVFFFLGWRFPDAHLPLRSNDISVNYVLNFLGGFYQFLPTFVFLCVQGAVFVLLLIVGWIGFRAVINGLVKSDGAGLVVGFSQCLFLIFLAVSSSMARGGTASGSAYALSYRYNSVSILFSLLLVVVLIQLGWLWRGRMLSSCVMSLAGLFVILGCWANATWLPVIQAHFSIRSKAVACLQAYTRRRDQGEKQGELTDLSACARPIFEKGSELIYSRFAKACSTPAGWQRSRTVLGLCHDLGLRHPRFQQG